MVLVSLSVSLAATPSPCLEVGDLLIWFGVGGGAVLTHEITIVRGQGRQRAYAEDRGIYVLV